MLKKIYKFTDSFDISLDASCFAFHVLWNNFQCAWKTHSPLDEKGAFQGTLLQLSKDLCLMLKSCFQNPGILLRSKLLFGRVLLVMYLLFKCLLKLPSSLFGSGGEQGKAEPAKRCWLPREHHRTWPRRNRRKKEEQIQRWGTEFPSQYLGGFLKSAEQRRFFFQSSCQNFRPCKGGCSSLKAAGFNTC